MIILQGDTLFLWIIKLFTDWNNKALLGGRKYFYRSFFHLAWFWVVQIQKASYFWLQWCWVISVRSLYRNGVDSLDKTLTASYPVTSAYPENQLFGRIFSHKSQNCLLLYYAPIVSCKSNWRPAEGCLYSITLY